MNCKMASWQRKMQHRSGTDFRLSLLVFRCSKKGFISILMCLRKKISHLTHIIYQLDGSTAPYTLSAKDRIHHVFRLRNWCSFQESLGTHGGIVAAGLWCCCLKFTARWGIAASWSRCGAVEKKMGAKSWYKMVQSQLWDMESLFN